MPEKIVPYTGAAYRFIDKKSSNDAAFGDQDCAKPDPSTVENGPAYTLADLDEESAKTMIESSNT